MTRFSSPTSNWTIVVTGAISLAVAIGIGRFAFTPLLPMMLRDGVLDLEYGSWLATANYAGYLIGALISTFLPMLRRARPVLSDASIVRGGLMGTVMTTAGIGALGSEFWLILRFLSGIFSAVAFVSTATLCVSALHARGKGSFGSVIYAGPGLGIAITSIAASLMIANGFTHAQGWFVFAVVGAALTIPVWRSAGAFPISSDLGSCSERNAAPASRPAIAIFVVAYGIYGFGYIVFATFLPVIARQKIGSEAFADLFWAVFGFAAVLGALLTILMPAGWNRRKLLAGSYVLQALGIALVVAGPTTPAFFVGSFAVGLPFTAMVFFAIQEAGRLLPKHASSLVAAMTASFGGAQLCGPIMAGIVIGRLGDTTASFDLMLKIAVTTLMIGAMLFLYRVPSSPSDESG